MSRNAKKRAYDEIESYPHTPPTKRFKTQEQISYVKNYGSIVNSDRIRQTELRFRPLTKERIPELKNLFNEAFGDNNYFSKRQYYEDIRDGDKEALILCSNNTDQIIGASVILMEKCYIDAIAIHPCFRRNGFGSILLCATCEFIKSEVECAYIWLHVHTNNKAAKYMYEKAGFEVKKEEIRFYDTKCFGTQNAYDMRLKILDSDQIWNRNTPVTKGGLRALRVVDLKQKLKKYHVKPHGKKEDLVNEVFNYKNKNKTDNNNEHDSDQNSVMYEWIDKHIKKSDGKTYYKGIRVNNSEFYIGSECYIHTEKGEEWMAQIVELFEDEGGNPCMGNMWYWKYHEIENRVKNKEIIRNNGKDKKLNEEIILSCGHEPDINHILSIYTKKQFKVFDSKYELEIYKKNKKESKNIKLFFSRYYVDKKTKKLVQNTMG